ncbi:MAG: polysaccharide biosynthesis tyrosine autokinase [bacterium]|nr:polysaccharide biosynthesis tyrosine autokinase [bacterium]
MVATLQQEYEIVTQEQSVSLKEYINVLFARRWVILGAVFLTVAAAVLFTALKAPVFETSLRIMIEPPNSVLSERAASGGYFSGVSLDKQIALLRRYPLAEAVSERLKAADDPLEVSPVKILSGLAAHANKESNIIEVVYRSNDSREAAEVANAVGEIFIIQSTDMSRESNKRAREYITAQMDIARGQLNRAEEKIKGFKEKTGIMELSSTANGIVNSLAGVEDQMADLKVQMIEKRTRMNEFKAQLREQNQALLSSLESVSSSPTVEKLKESLVDGEIKLASLSAEYTDKHPEVVKCKAELEAVRIRLAGEIKRAVSGSNVDLDAKRELCAQVAELQTDIMTAEAKSCALSSLGEEMKTGLSRLPGQEVSLARLMREKEVNENIYTMLLQKQEEIRINEVMQTGNARLVENAPVPQIPVEPKPKQNILLGLILGLAIGLGLAFLLDHLDDTVKTLADVEQKIGLSALGIIPRIKADDKIISNLDHRDPVVEAYRTLRSNIAFTSVDRPVRSFLITSPGVSEGKSLTAANLALSMAMNNKNVILVDSDLRRPTQHTSFGLAHGIGLTSVISGGIALKDAVQDTNIENLKLLASGPIPPNPVELLASNRMEEIIKDLEDMAEVVIYDLPPCLALTDSLVLASRLDGVILVLDSSSVAMEAAMRARNIFDNARVRLLGAVLNNVRVDGGGYLNYNYYYYYYYGQDTKKTRHNSPLKRIFKPRKRRQEA